MAKFVGSPAFGGIGLLHTYCFNFGPAKKLMAYGWTTPKKDPYDPFG